jgi:hypothetical protein
MAFFLSLPDSDSLLLLLTTSDPTGTAYTKGITRKPATSNQLLCFTMAHNLCANPSNFCCRQTVPSKIEWWVVDGV